jgi:hypothetical protein
LISTPRVCKLDKVNEGNPGDAELRRLHTDGTVDNDSE